MSKLNQQIDSKIEILAEKFFDYCKSREEERILVNDAMRALDRLEIGAGAPELTPDDERILDELIRKFEEL